MIIAWGLFILSAILGIVNLFVIVTWFFTDKLNREEDMYKSYIKPFLFYFAVSLCSAQYIWG